MDPINTALNHFISIGLSEDQAKALVNQGLTAYNQMSQDVKFDYPRDNEGNEIPFKQEEPKKFEYFNDKQPSYFEKREPFYYKEEIKIEPKPLFKGGRAGYAAGGLGSLMQAPQGMQQAASGQMDPQQAIQIIIQLLVENGVPLEVAKKLAIQMLQIFMQGGEPALNQFADQLEQQEQQAMAQGGIAGLHPRQHYLFGGIGKIFSGIGKAVSGVVKGVANAVKSVVKSDIGKLALLAGGAYLMMNPGMLAGLGGGAAAAGAAEGAAALEAAGLGAAGAGAGAAGTSAATAAGGLGGLGAGAIAPEIAAAGLGAGTAGAGSTVAGLGAADFAGTSLAIPSTTPGIIGLPAEGIGTTVAGTPTVAPSISDKFISAIQNPGKTLMDLGQGAYDYVKENKIRTAFDVANLAGLYSAYGKQPTPTSLGTGQRKGQVEPYLRASAQRLHPEWTQQQLDQFVQSNLSEYAAQGGIMGYRKGYEDAGVVEMASEPSGMDELDSVAKEIFGKGFDQLDEKQQEQLQDWIKSRRPSAEQQPVFNQMVSPDAYVKLVEYYMSLGYDYEKASKLAYEHFKTGEEQAPRHIPGNFRDYKKVAMGGFIPPARKAGGIMELDARDTGGFIPYGKKERHDDVPAVLAKNEFVFTSKAVRNAGGGDIKKGAKKMYALMKQLEGKRA